MKKNTSWAIRNLVMLVCCTVLLNGCSSTQKTSGQGMVSVVAQNVVRIAGYKAVQDISIDEVREKKCHVKVTGFADDFNEGFIRNLVRKKIEDHGGFLVDESRAELIAEVVINAAGNDLGVSRYIIGSSARSEGTVDLTLVLRDAVSGRRLSSQHLIGESKYSQGSVLGVQGSGAYFVKTMNGWDAVKDPSSYE